MVGVSKHTLFYYDREGVFCPEKKDDNGFRGYSIFQIESFFVIKSLKDMGVPLSTIKKYLETRSPENCLELLSEHKSLLKQEIKKLNHTIKLMEEKENAIKAYFKQGCDHPKIVFEEKETLFITESDLSDYYTAFTNHIKSAMGTTLNLPSAVGHIIKNEDFEAKEYFDYYFSKINKSGPSTMVKSSGNYLIYYHKNGYFTIDEAYEKVVEYAQTNHIKLGEYFYEYMILDELSVNGIENYVIKIAIAVID